MKLKPKDIPTMRAELLAINNGHCALCKEPVRDPCLDHSHATGLCRDTVCRSCNSALGRIENLTRYGVRDAITFARLAADYLEEHLRHPSSMVHPAYRTEDERKALAKKRRARKAKLKRTKPFK